MLAAYACLAPRIVTGQFDPTRHRAIWPSTGNYARGGIAISRIMASRGVAILPEGMSQERFDWLDRWCATRRDVIRTPGTESNVKEIYDACNELARDPDNVVLNQFCEFGNHLAHYEVTGRGLRARLRHASSGDIAALRLAAFVSATGSAGTIAAGDRLKDALRHPHRRRRGAGVPDDARERLRRAQHPGHRRQAHPADPQRDEHRRRRRRLGPGDRRARRLFNTDVGRATSPTGGGVDPSVVAAVRPLRLLVDSANVLAAIKTAKLLGLGPDDVDRHRRHRRRRDVPERAGAHLRAGASAAGSTTSTPARSSAATSPTSTPTT